MSPAESPLSAASATVGSAPESATPVSIRSGDSTSGAAGSNSATGAACPGLGDAAGVDCELSVSFWNRRLGSVATRGTSRAFLMSRADSLASRSESSRSIWSLNSLRPRRKSATVLPIARPTSGRRRPNSRTPRTSKIASSGPPGRENARRPPTGSMAGMIRAPRKGVNHRRGRARPDRGKFESTREANSLISPPP